MYASTPNAPHPMISGIVARRSGELPFQVAGEHHRTEDQGEREQARDPSKCEEGKQRQWPALAAHDRDCDPEDGGGRIARPEELGQPIFVGLLITRLRLGQPA